MKLFALTALAGISADKAEIQAQCDRAITEYPDCMCSDIYWKGGKERV